MVKGVSVKFKSYEETIPKLLNVIKFNDEIKKHEQIVLKPNLINGNKEDSTKVEFLESVLKFCMENKNPGTEIFIAEGCNGHDTMDIFNEFGYRKLAEKYGVSLIDLNKVETEEIENEEFLRFENIFYPKVLVDSFVISLPLLRNDEEMEMSASLDNMLGAFPAKHYKSFFSKEKNKLKKWPLKYQIHDILKCKMPNFALLDASEKGLIFAGQPLEIDKQAAKVLGLDWKSVGHLKLIDESFSDIRKIDKEVDNVIKERS
ncbi:MAG: DUF362 domain-containing protein [Nanoarchaeota archaeon]|nr:DUF362 domain-containing protein [Nanoarchaeota archaeon]